MACESQQSEPEYDRVTQASMNGLYVKAQELDRGHNQKAAPAFAPPGAMADTESHASNKSDAWSHASIAETADAEAHASNGPDAWSHASDADMADAESHASSGPDAQSHASGANAHEDGFPV